MAVYENLANAQPLQKEIHLYGSSRLGILTDFTVPPTINYLANGGFGVSYFSTFTRGEKFFELSNHLGNVLVTVSDKKLAVDSDGNGVVDYYNADVVTASDYYPFGMAMPGRKYSQPNSSYRYGFNGQENSDEIAAGLTTALYWEYDSRIGRRWNVDPVDDESISPYSCFESNPILMSDVDGDVPENSLDGDNDEPDDEFKKLKDGTLVKIGSKGGDAIDYIYQSSQQCLMCADTDNGRYNTLTVEKLFNPSYLFDDNDNYVLNVKYSGSKRLGPGEWEPPLAVNSPASGEAGFMDPTDFVPGKALAKGGFKLLAFALIKKGTSEFVEKKAKVAVVKALVKTNANSKSSKKAQIIYGLQNNTSKKIEKVGLSSGKKSKQGIPYRATSQINKLPKDKYKAVVLDTQAAGKNARAKGLKKEIKQTNANASSINPDLHQRPKPQK